MKLHIIILLILFSASAPAVEILDVVVSRNVHNREPQSTYNPPGHCSSPDSGNHSIPVINSASDRVIYIWNRVKAESSDSLLHIYYKDGLEFRTQRTEWTTTDRILNTIEWIKASLNWKEIAKVELEFRHSKSWRTWSSKQIDPIVHIGHWRVDITTASNPANILCTTEFDVI